MFAKYGSPFTAEDLAANRDGYLTKSQRAMLSQDRRWWLFLIWLKLFGCPTLSVFTIIDGVRINDTVESRFAIVALICVLAGIGLIYAWDKWRVLNFDLKKGYVSSLNGIVDVRHERHRNGFRYSIKLPNMTFHDVAWAIVNNIHPGEEYTIYYVPSSLRILSFEPFDGEV